MNALKTKEYSQLELKAFQAFNLRFLNDAHAHAHHPLQLFLLVSWETLKKN